MGKDKTPKEKKEKRKHGDRKDAKLIRNIDLFNK